MKSKRSFTAQQRLAIVLEGLRGDSTVADVCRRHEITPTLFYHWRPWYLEDHATLPAELWPVIAAEVRCTRRRSGWPVRQTLAAMGVSVATYYRQRRRSRTRVDEAGYVRSTRPCPPSARP